jgi:hypothetical protein
MSDLSPATRAAADALQRHASRNGYPLIGDAEALACAAMLAAGPIVEAELAEKIALAIEERCKDMRHAWSTGSGAYVCMVCASHATLARQHATT